MTLDPVKRDFLERWASDNKCYLQDHGEVGFGRACVGVCNGSSYVDLPLYPADADRKSPEMQNYHRQWSALPVSPEDAYHKHDCLAVLVHNNDYDKALEQLFTWVTDLNDKGFTVKIQDRETYNKDGFGRMLELAMGSISQAVLTLDP